MARSIQEIKAQMVTAKNAETSLSGLNSTSQTAIWNLWLYIQAVAINLFEQILDLVVVDIDTKISKVVPQSPAWLQQKAFEFQYSATSPQQLFYTQNTNGEIAPQYQTINEDLRIVTRCAVTTGSNKTVLIKTAKGTTPVKLLTAELDALKSYFNLIGNAGIAYEVSSLDADLIEIQADIYYSGIFQPTIQADVISAINNYFATLDFNGRVYVSHIEDAIQSVAGVVDLKMKIIYVRQSTVIYANKTTLYKLSSGYNGLSYLPYAGYIKAETTSGHTFANTLNFIVV
jgi:hypothetical protein